MSQTDPLGIGFVGAGFITRVFHAETLQAIPHARCTGIMNPTTSKAETVAANVRSAEAGDPAVYDSVRELVADPDVDALWVTSPNYVRVDTVEAVVEELEQGDAALTGIAIEKPLARTLSEARRVVDLVEEAGLAHAYLENQLYMPGIQQMKELLWEAASDAGRPYLARAAEEHSGPHSAWFWDGEKQGGGVLNDMMCHSHEVNRHLLSNPDRADELEPVAVSADVSTLKWGREEYAEELRDAYGVDYEDSPSEDYARAQVFYETEDGSLAVGEATNSWCYVGDGLRITVELLGPEYSGSLDTLASGTDVFYSSSVEDEAGYVVEKQEASQGRLAVVPDEVTTYGYVDQNRHVVDAFRRGESAREDLHDGLDVVELCMASYRAAEAGERIDLASTDLEDYVPEPARGTFEAGVDGIR